MRIAHVITRMIVGGAQENTALSAIGQRRLGHEVTLVTGPESGAEGELVADVRAAGVEVVVVPDLVRRIAARADAAALAGLHRVLARLRPDLVHTHSSKAGILGRIAARMAGVPCVVHTLHSLVFHPYQSAARNAVYVAAKRAMVPLTDAYVSVCAATMNGALAKGIGRPERHHVVYSGMRLDAFDRAASIDPAAARARFGIPPEAVVVGKIARLVELKGHDELLDAAVRFDRRVRLLLVGDGPFRGDLTERARRLGILDRVHFAGLLRPEEVPVAIQATDVVVHLSLREGLPRVVPQAGLMKRPVVAYDLDGTPEAVREGETGYLVRPGDLDLLARHVNRLADDPDARRRMGEAARRFIASRFDDGVMVRALERIYAETWAAKFGERWPGPGTVAPTAA